MKSNIKLHENANNFIIGELNQRESLPRAGFLTLS